MIHKVLTEDIAINGLSGFVCGPCPKLPAASWHIGRTFPTKVSLRQIMKESTTDTSVSVKATTIRASNIRINTLPKVSLRAIIEDTKTINSPPTPDDDKDL